MAEYTNKEYTDMVLAYGEAIGNRRAGIYQERYQHCVSPSHTLFATVIQRLRGRGTFTVNRADCGALRRRRTHNFEEDVLHRVEETPSTSTRIIVCGMRVTQRTFWEVLHEQQLHHFYTQGIFNGSNRFCTQC